MTQLNAAHFRQHFVLYLLKKGGRQKGGKHALLFKKMARSPASMTSYLATLATDSHQLFVKLCLKDRRTATENGRRR